jgi:hypothetical protein
MAAGSPLFRSRAGSDNLVPGGWGVQPAGPLPSIPRGLPSKQTLDYVHTFTQTSLLLAGVVVFLIVYRGRPRAGLRKLVGRVT